MTTPSGWSPQVGREWRRCSRVTYGLHPWCTQHIRSVVDSRCLESHAPRGDSPESAALIQSPDDPPRGDGPAR